MIIIVMIMTMIIMIIMIIVFVINGYIYDDNNSNNRVAMRVLKCLVMSQEAYAARPINGVGPCLFLRRGSPDDR